MLELGREPRSESSTGLNWSLVSRQERGEIKRADHGERVGRQGGAGRSGRGRSQSARPGLSTRRGPDTAPDGAHLCPGHSTMPCQPARRLEGRRRGAGDTPPPPGCSLLRGSASSLGSAPCPPPPQPWLQGSAPLLFTCILFARVCLLQGASQGTFYSFPTPVKAGFHALFMIYRFPETCSPFGGEGNDERALPDSSGSFRDSLPAHFLDVKSGALLISVWSTVSQNESCPRLQESRRELPGPRARPTEACGAYFSRGARRQGAAGAGANRKAPAAEAAQPGGAACGACPLGLRDPPRRLPRPDPWREAPRPAGAAGHTRPSAGRAQPRGAPRPPGAGGGPNAGLQAESRQSLNTRETAGVPERHRQGLGACVRPHTCAQSVT